jgi:hypothetical protein
MEEHYAQDILGRTATADYGLRYLLDLLSQHRLNAIFFVESLHASALRGAACVTSFIADGRKR